MSVNTGLYTVFFFNTSLPTCTQVQNVNTSALFEHLLVVSQAADVFSWLEGGMHTMQLCPLAGGRHDTVLLRWEEQRHRVNYGGPSPRVQTADSCLVFSAACRYLIRILLCHS